MMLYTEDFKKQVVRKVLSPGVILSEVCRKLEVSRAAVGRWKALYAKEVQQEIQQIDVESLLYEAPVDVEELLRKADGEELAQASGSQALAQQMDFLRCQGKSVSQYTDADRYAIVMSLRALPSEQRGQWLRQLGLQSPHIRLWEEQLITMSKKPIAADQYTKGLEDEIKHLRKQLGEAERDNRELKILIELKKKYPTLFQQDEDKS
jgi:transposase-like protein